jgi:tRNA uridine 5-carboxymethylaminomethyl modification enzyme
MEFNTIVIGAGHAGIEAALASARMGIKTILITGNLDTIGHMSCNPAIGGIGKGQIVREIDALGGEMGIAIDSTGIQFRMLNTGKGRAVWSPRAQADRKQYARYMKRVVESTENLHLMQGWVEEILVENGAVSGVRTNFGTDIRAECVILCPGTFLNGLLHIGDKSFPGGRMGESASVALAAWIRKAGIETGRLKTGTPPRVNKNSLDFSKMKVQKGDERPRPFSFRTKQINRPQTECWLTWTNPRTHSIISENLDRAPLYTGRIKGTGPRYCPSIEVKIVRFSDKESHQLFLEPEGLDTDEMYVNGFATSIPIDVQEDALRTVAGMEHVEILRYGYAVEYDFVLPHQLEPTLEYKGIRGLFLAGQINGTSGYEEAAGQGLIAGINAALRVLGKDPFYLDRSQAYIGVMIDDLITREITEPYRMFTSRAEYRLFLRQDNAHYRLMGYGRQFGLIDDETFRAMEQERELVEKTIHTLEGMRFQYGNSSVTLLEYLKRPEVTFSMLSERTGLLPAIDDGVREQIETEVKYGGYLKRELEIIRRFQQAERIRIPPDINYDVLHGLSTEAREKLCRYRPVSIGQASRIDGVSPSDITAILVYLKKRGIK